MSGWWRSSVGLPFRENTYTSCEWLEGTALWLQCHCPLRTQFSMDRCNNNNSSSNSTLNGFFSVYIISIGVLFALDPAAR